MVNPQFLAIRRNLQPGYVAFRQRGTLLEYSLDNVTWQLAYDFADMANSQAQTVITNYNEFLETITTNYDGTPQSIAPGLTYDGSWKDAARDKSLCVMITIALDVIRATINSQRPLLNNSDEGQIGAGVLSTGAGVLGGMSALAAASATGLFLGISAVTLGVGAIVGIALAGLVTIFTKHFETTLDLEHWDNDAAIDEVSCFMYSALRGQNVTYARWKALKTALKTYPTPDPYDPLEDAKRKIAGDIFLIDENDGKFYLALISAAGALVDNSPFAGDCECEPVWDYTCDFTLRPYSDYVIPERDIHNTLVPLNYVPTRGYAAVTSITGGRSDRGVFMSVNFPGFPTANVATDITRIDVEYDYTQGSYTSPLVTFSGQMNLRNGLTTSLPAFTLNSLAIPNGVNVTTGTTGSVPDGNNVYVYIRCGFDRTGGEPGGNVIIRKIRIFGTGVNPFELLP